MDSGRQSSRTFYLDKFGPTFWIAFRTLSIVICVLDSHILLDQFAYSRVTWSHSVITGLFGLAFPIFGISSLNSESRAKLHRPSWLVNPFSLRQTLVGTHYVSHLAIAIGAGCALAIFRGIEPPAAWPYASFFFALGAGVWVGTWLSVYWVERDGTND